MLLIAAAGVYAAFWEPMGSACVFDSALDLNRLLGLHLLLAVDWTRIVIIFLCAQNEWIKDWLCCGQI